MRLRMTIEMLRQRYGHHTRVGEQWRSQAVRVRDLEADIHLARLQISPPCSNRRSSADDLAG
jgi:hypothetical protein